MSGRDWVPLVFLGMGWLMGLAAGVGLAREWFAC